MRLIQGLLKTDGDISRTLLRVLLAVVIFPHGAQKLLGWFGGGGFRGTVQWMTGSFHVPVVIAVLPILVESVGMVALAAGFLTRVVALAIAVDMAVAVALVHLGNGFFMNWAGTQKGEGFEYHVLVGAISLALMIKGGGRWSVDRAIAGRSAL